MKRKDKFACLVVEFLHGQQAIKSIARHMIYKLTKWGKRFRFSFRLFKYQSNWINICSIANKCLANGSDWNRIYSYCCYMCIYIYIGIYWLCHESVREKEHKLEVLIISVPASANTCKNTSTNISVPSESQYKI